MIFDSPQWKWRTAYEPQKFGFVENVVRMHPVRGREFEGYVVVPTEFFQLLPVVFAGEELAHAQTQTVEFYMDEMEDHSWVLGVETKDGRYGADLWRYTNSSLPPWFDVAKRNRK